MRRGFYARLAWTGMRNNRKLYLPFLLSNIGMILMYCILATLCRTPLLENMRGGGSLGFVLVMGQYVIAIFAAIFLLYTNSFLIRRRFKEFGLYHVLGMDKRGLAQVLLWETLMLSLASLAGGLLLGIALSKLAELGLLNAIRMPVDYRFTLSPDAVLGTVAIFGAIDVLLLLRALWLVIRSKPLELLHSENFGEKPPKANWALALLGLLLLGGAYALAIWIKHPVTAVTLFFVAVVMVILATYLLFMAGSVSLCKLLQRCRGYYYKKNHFVSVASMSYRMKRNGAGLASICILATMVLVMISSSASLYFGANDAIRARHPRDNELTINAETAAELATLDTLDEVCDDALRNYTPYIRNREQYACANTAGLLRGDTLFCDREGVQYNAIVPDDLRYLAVYSLEEYNRLAGTELALAPGQAYVYGINCDYTEPQLRIGDVELCFEIAGQLDKTLRMQDNQSVFPTLVLIVPELEVLKPLESLTDEYGLSRLSYQWYYGYDIDADDAVQIAAQSVLIDMIRNEHRFASGITYTDACRARDAEDFFMTFGGLFFIGIVLSIVFLFAAAMIIYYKQLAEGYEDQARFAIMQQVGMTTRDIRKSINSQVLTVFSAPLVFAGLHLAFAFPLVWKLLQLFSLHNLPLVIGTTLCSFALFGVFYAVIYKVTARVYYRIVAAE